MRVTPTCDSINSLCISDAANIQKAPDIVFGGGTYFTVWSDARGGTYMIFGARVTTSGNVVDPGGIAISNGSGDLPSVDFDGSRFFVVWSWATTIRGTFVTTGGAPQDSVKIASGTAAVYSPNIAFDGTNYLVLWLAWTGSGYEILGQLVSPSGVLVGPRFTVAATNVALKPGLSFDGTHYVITWTQSNDIYARQYDTSGSPLGPAFPVSTHSDIQFYGDVASGTDRYLFVWAQSTTSGYDIYGNIDVVIGITEQNTYAERSGSIKSALITDYMYFNNPINQRINVFDINGRCIGTTRNNKFDCRHLAPGVYFTQIDEKITGKVIKVR